MNMFPEWFKLYGYFEHTEKRAWRKFFKHIFERNPEAEKVEIFFFNEDENFPYILYQSKERHDNNIVPSCIKYPHGHVFYFTCNFDNIDDSANDDDLSEQLHNNFKFNLEMFKKYWQFVEDFDCILL